MARCLSCGSKNLRIKDTGLMEIKIASDPAILVKILIYVCNDCGEISLW